MYRNIGFALYIHIYIYNGNVIYNNKIFIFGTRGSPCHYLGPQVYDTEGHSLLLRIESFSRRNVVGNGKQWR